MIPISFRNPFTRSILAYKLHAFLSFFVPVTIFKASTLSWTGIWSYFGWKKPVVKATFWENVGYLCGKDYGDKFVAESYEYKSAFDMLTDNYFKKDEPEIVEEAGGYIGAVKNFMVAYSSIMKIVLSLIVLYVVYNLIIILIHCIFKLMDLVYIQLKCLVGYASMEPSDDEVLNKVLMPKLVMNNDAMMENLEERIMSLREKNKVPRFIQFLDQSKSFIQGGSERLNDLSAIIAKMLNATEESKKFGKVFDMIDYKFNVKKTKVFGNDIYEFVDASDVEAEAKVS